MRHKYFSRLAVMLICLKQLSLNALILASSTPSSHEEHAQTLEVIVIPMHLAHEHLDAVADIQHAAVYQLDTIKLSSLIQLI